MIPIITNCLPELLDGFFILSLNPANPTIAKPTLTGIFLKAPKTKETTEDTAVESQDISDDAACLNSTPFVYPQSRCGAA